MSSTKLLGIYSNGMVLQRNKEIIIEGEESAASEVRVTLADRTVAAPVENGRFKAVFEPMDVVFDTVLKVEGSEEITIKDVCIGDVFMLSGQSNMELPVIRTYELNKDEIEAEDYPYVRQYLLTPDLELPEKGGTSICKLPEIEWTKAVGAGKDGFSAVGFYAAKRIFEAENIPIGLILNAQGGSTIEAWMCDEDLYASGISEDELAPLRGRGALKAYVDDWQQRSVDWRSKAINNSFDIEEAMKNAVTVTLPGIVVRDFSGVVWLEKEIFIDDPCEGDCLLRLGDLIDADVTYINGVEVGRTEYQYPPRIYHFDGSVLKQGKNVIRTRLIVEQEYGGFVEGHPYYLKTASQKIELSGEWKMVEEIKLSKFEAIPMAQMLPATLYYASVLTIKNIAISQIWWYQGESNAGDPDGLTAKNATLSEQLWDQDESGKINPRGYDQKMIRTFKKMRELFGEVPIILVKMADYINPLTFETEVPEGWRKIQTLQETAPEYISNVKVVNAPAPSPVYELHPQNKSALGADFAKASMEF
ncbi:MAG: sialate O-acetylesterase [Saccharofermentans sp.]|nr:sialate O-acetylesterase [Saccharofermentans sp.]